MPQPVGPVTSTSPCVVGGETRERRRQAELLEARRLGRDEAEDGVDAALLAIEIDAEAAGARDLVAEIEVAVLG